MKAPVLIMGVINITPDSFSDGGQYVAPDAAIAKAKALLAGGAQILDLGAESTRPGAAELTPEAEWSRLEPVFRRLHADLPSAFTQAMISVDTRHPDVMRRAAAAGARMINDVGGAKHDRSVLADLAKIRGLHYVAMHMHATPATMQDAPLTGQDAVDAVDTFFVDATAALKAAGFDASRIWLDPGIGFGKTDAGNSLILREIPRWTAAHQVAIGISRKSFLGRALGIERPIDRDAASKGLELGLAVAGARLIRTHDVAGLSRLLKAWRDGGE